MMKKKIITSLLALLIGQVIQAQNNAIFFGGQGDGHAAVSYFQTVNEINRGGDGDGWASISYQQNADAGLFQGGDGDGWTALNYAQVADATLFQGGDGDGWTSLNYAQVADATLFQGGNGDGWASIVLPIGPLPIELLSFTAQQQEAFHLLKWQTSLELNSSHFVIEHSTDAKSFRELGMRNASGQSTQPLNYDFLNKSPLKGNNFYRLKLTDLDGKFKYSNVVLLKVLDDKSSILLYPNPASSLLNVEFINMASNTTIAMRVIDITGKTIWQTKSQHTGITAQIDISKFASGIYQLLIETPDEKQTIKFNKL